MNFTLKTFLTGTATFEPGGQINRFYPENRSRIHELCGVIRAMHNQK